MWKSGYRQATRLPEALGIISFNVLQQSGYGQANRLPDALWIISVYMLQYRNHTCCKRHSFCANILTFHLVSCTLVFSNDLLFLSVLPFYAPINFTAPCIIFSGGFFSLRGGLGLGTRDFIDDSCAIWSPKKLRVPGPNPPSNEKYQPENIMQGAVKFIGA